MNFKPVKTIIILLLDRIRIFSIRKGSMSSSLLFLKRIIFRNPDLFD